MTKYIFLITHIAEASQAKQLSVSRGYSGPLIYGIHTGVTVRAFSGKGGSIMRREAALGKAAGGGCPRPFPGKLPYQPLALTSGQAFSWTPRGKQPYPPLMCRGKEASRSRRVYRHAGRLSSERREWVLGEPLV